MTRSTMIILAPWILFSVALAAVAIRLACSRGGPGRRGGQPAEPKAPTREAPTREVPPQDEPGD
jgi:hypothetical protein